MGLGVWQSACRLLLTISTFMRKLWRASGHDKKGYIIALCWIMLRLVCILVQDVKAGPLRSANLAAADSWRLVSLAMRLDVRLQQMLQP